MNEDMKSEFVRGTIVNQINSNKKYHLLSSEDDLGGVKLYDSERDINIFLLKDHLQVATSQLIAVEIKNPEDDAKLIQILNDNGYHLANSKQIIEPFYSFNGPISEITYQINKTSKTVYYIYGSLKGSLTLSKFIEIYCQTSNIENKEEETPNLKSEYKDLTKILANSIDEIIFSHAYGEVKINKIDFRDNLTVISCLPVDSVKSHNWYKDGRASMTGLVDLYPSKELYEKYPTDSNRAWNEYEKSKIVRGCLSAIHNSDSHEVILNIKYHHYKDAEECRQKLFELFKDTVIFEI